MKSIIKNRCKRVLAVSLIFMVGVMMFSPTQLSADTCQRALGKCAVDALIAGIFGGSLVLLSYATGCLAGYKWCLRYYEF